MNHYDENHQSSGHLYITRVPNITGDQRNEIIIKMAERGIACNVHYKPLPMLSAYKNLGFDIKTIQMLIIDLLMKSHYLFIQN